MIKKKYGFTLIELAVVLFIISLLMVGLLGPVATQIESRERQQTVDTMNDIMEALYGYAVINGYLPCPDTDGDGTADPENTSGDCVVPGVGDGWLPWRTLGLNFQGDVWGNRFKYHVTAPDFTTVDNGVCAADDNLDLCEVADITIRTRADNPGTGGIVESKFQYNVATNVPAIVISHGKNNLGATRVFDGGATAAATAGTDEEENDDANTDAIFYSRNFTEGGTGCTDDTDEANILCEFDDIVMWISPNILMNRMVKAERLP